jgi:serine/threonine protein phosphatase 1
MSTLYDMQVSISDWQPAPIILANETVFAIGDVHGCAKQLQVLLDTIRTAQSPAGFQRRLVYLGDLIDRGPDNIGTLQLWAEGTEARGVDRIDRVMGNHEQLLLLAMTDSPHTVKAATMWRSAAMGGERLLEEMWVKASATGEPPSDSLFGAAIGEDVLRLFRSQRSHIATGNLILVHGGLDPEIDRDELLARPWTSFTDARWAWVHGEFLRWQGGFNGKIVVHGHTPPHLHRELTGQEDVHLFAFDRLGLDGGTTRTGCVTGAQIEHGRYRILRAEPR